VYGFAGQEDFYRLDNGSTDLVSLGAHIEEAFPAADGLWTMNDASAGFTADFFNSDGQAKQSIPIDGYIEAVDAHALYISQTSTFDSSSELWEYPTDGTLPVQIGTPPPPYGGNEFDYFSNDPLLVGPGGLAQIWHVSESDTTPSALVIQWIPTQ